MAEPTGLVLSPPDNILFSKVNSGRLFQALAEETGVGILIFQGERIIYANPAMEKIVGYPQSEILGRPFWSRITPEVREAVRQQGLARQRGEDVPSDSEFEILTKGGEPKWVSTSSALLNLAGVTLVVATVIDITDRKKTEKALATSEEKCRILLKNPYLAIFIKQGDRIKYFNPRTIEIFGFPAEELISRRFSEFIHPEDRDLVLNRHFRRLQGESPLNIYPFRLVNAEAETRWVEIHVTQVTWEGESAALCFLTDISERRNLEEQLFQAQKLETIGRMVSGIVHDFNNMLLVINGYSGILLKYFSHENTHPEALEEIKKAGERAAHLSQQLLTLCRKQSAARKTTNLNELLKDLEIVIRRTVGETVTLSLVLAPDLGLIRGHLGHLQQVILNLVVNAREAMPVGGRLTIETSMEEITKKQSCLYCDHPYRPGKYVRMEVSDTGTGMKAEVKGRLFEPFFTTKHPEEGAGLGLVTVLRQVQGLEGHIQVDSDWGKGTAFRIYFPQTEEPEETSIPDYAQDLLLTGEETILLVEDEPVVQGVVENLLAMNGYRALTASDAQEAGKLWKEAEVDLLIIDVVLPDVNGKDLFLSLSADKPGAKALFISGHPMPEFFLEGLPSQAVGYLLKPFEPDEFLSLIRSLLDQPG
jgi:PAS domain S-box-containing protein